MRRSTKHGRMHPISWINAKTPNFTTPLFNTLKWDN